MITLVEFTRWCGFNMQTELVSINPESIVAVCEGSSSGGPNVRRGPGARIMLSSGASIDVMETRADVVAIIDNLADDDEDLTN